MIRVKSITNIEYMVQDLERSIEFFRDTLGFYVQRRTHKSGRLSELGTAAERGEHVFVGLGDTWIELNAPAQGVDPTLDYSLREKPRYVFAVAIDDLDDAIRQLTMAGIQTRPILEHPQSYWGRQLLVNPGPVGQPFVLREFRAPDGPQFMDWHPDELSG